MTVKFYTTPRLIEKYCRGVCTNSGECTPKIADNGENDGSGMNFLVIGCAMASECPIMARVWPSAGWVDASNHMGRCGEGDR
jgi:hypothetical protein